MKPNGPQINSSAATFGGVQVSGVGYADPDKFPLGLEIAIYAPGKLEPLGRITMPPGLAAAIIGPPAAARDLVAATRAARDQLAPGERLPPGM
jgi:hypothetical protein